MAKMEQLGMFGMVEGEVMPIAQAKKKLAERKLWMTSIPKGETFEQYQELHSFLCTTLVEAQQNAIKGIEKRTNTKYVNTWLKIKVKSGLVGAKELNELRNSNQIQYLNSLLKHISKAMTIASMNHKYFTKEEYYLILKNFKSTFPQGIKKSNLDKFELFIASKLKNLPQLK